MKHQILYSILTDQQLNHWEKLVNNNIESLLLYSDQLLWWNKKINLISRDVSHETVFEHIKHSLIIGALDCVQKAEHIIDAGSGGGIPGIPLALSYPNKTILLNDIVSKKVMSMKQIAYKLKLDNVSTVHGSVALLEMGASQLVVSKHAFKVDELVGLLGDRKWSTLIFLKGANEAESEIRKLDIPVSSNIIELEMSLDDPFYKGKGIVEVRKLNEKL